MKVLVADLALENRLLKKSMIEDGGDQEGDTLPPRNWRSSSWSSNRMSRCDVHSASMGTPAQLPFRVSDHGLRRNVLGVLLRGIFTTLALSLKT